MSLSVDTVDIKKKIDNCKTLQELEVIRLEYLGKKGLLPFEMKLLGKLPIDQKKIKGQELNKLKTFIESSITDQKILIENLEIEQKLQNDNSPRDRPRQISLAHRGAKPLAWRLRLSDGARSARAY
mgnify:CR=1 FL=1